MPGNELTSIIASKKNLLKPASRPRTDPSTTKTTTNNIPSVVVSKPESEVAKSAEDGDGVELSPDLEREICLAVNRELHVSYCYLVMGGIFTRQGLKSFSGMCERQEDTHRGVARELVAHVVSRGGRLRLADIAEPGPACGAQVSCAEAVRVGLRLEQWLLETFSVAQEVATKEDDIAADYLSALLARQMEEVEDAEMLVSRVLFNSWQDKKYWLETISDDAKEMQMVSISETSGCETDEEDTLTFSQDS